MIIVPLLLFFLSSFITSLLCELFEKSFDFDQVDWNKVSSDTIFGGIFFLFLSIPIFLLLLPFEEDLGENTMFFLYVTIPLWVPLVFRLINN